jgi:replicative DNA helicase
MAIAEIPDIHNHQSDGIPHNIDAEQAVLGALLMQNALLEDVADIIGAEAFYDPLHGALFTEIAKLIDGGRAADLITLKPIVNGWPPISETMQVWQYLGRLLTAAASRVEIKGYARLLRDLSDRRRVVWLAQDVLSLAMADPSDVPTPDVIETAERGLFEIGAKRTEGRETSIDGAVHQAIEAISNAYERGGELNGVRTGLIDLDRILGGFQASDLIILGGRPSMGKTALALTIAFNVARDGIDGHGVVTPGGHVHFFSQEMSASQLAMRLIAERSEIASDTLRRGAVNENELRSAIEGAKQVSAASMTIDETGGISLGALIAKARRVKRKKDTKLIVVDYLQLMSGAKNSDNRVQEITKLTMGLKALAKELDVPIVALSQLSRKVEERADKRPQLADLRESGSIEQDADVVMFVYRDEYYIEREKPDDADAVKYADWLARMDRAHGKAEVLVAKQRHGAVGSVALSFQSKFTRFGNLGGGHGGR